MMSSVTAILSELEWTILKLRQQNSRLTMLSKIVKQFIPIALHQYYHQHLVLGFPETPFGLDFTQNKELASY